MPESIALSAADFEKLRPLNGMVILKGIQDPSRIMIGGQEMYYEGSYTPEENQVVINEVVKVPRSSYRDADIESHIVIRPGDVVWVNYYAILQAQELYVEGQIYKIISYRTLFMVRRNRGPHALYFMLNDYLLLKPIYRDDPSPLVPDNLKRKQGKFFYEVERTFLPTTFSYLRHIHDYLHVEPGDIVMVKDSNQFRLEHPPHFHYNKELRFITRIEKVVMAVDCPPSTGRF